MIDAACPVKTPSESIYISSRALAGMEKKIAPPPTQLCDLLAARRPLVMPLVLALREMIIRIAPEAHELVYSNYAVVDVFTFTGRQSDAFCHIVAYEDHVNLGFNHGVTLSDPKKLLIGTGKKIRHIHIESRQDLKLPLRSYIRAAVKQAV
jgi:hypothetical protein